MVAGLTKLKESPESRAQRIAEMHMTGARRLAVDALNKFTTTLKPCDNSGSFNPNGTQFFDRHAGLSLALPDEPAGASRIGELERQLAEQAATISDQANQILSLQIELANYKALLAAAAPAVEKPADPLARALACTGRKPVIGLYTP